MIRVTEDVSASKLPHTSRTLTTLDLEPVILHEQADRGRTIIKKFYEHSDVGFVAVLSRVVTDYIASMMEQQALKMHQRLTGVSLVYAAPSPDRVRLRQAIRSRLRPTTNAIKE